jgi:hypothetical protein
MRGNAGPGPRDGQFSRGSEDPGLAEALVVLGLFALVGILKFVTYSRIPPNELYHVSSDGIAGGASRLLVFLNYPTALMAMAVLVMALDRLLAAGERRAIWVAVVAFCLCAAIVVPGVVDQGDLDAKLVNVIPALGVLLVVFLVVWAAQTGGIGGAARATGDRARIVAAAVLSLVALPWIFAEAGFYIGDVPLLGDVFRSEQVFEGHPSVHLGQHHGLEGFLLVLTALLLTRELPRMRATWRRTALAAYLSLMIPYGAGNMANDAWLEQVVKRGWTDWEIPGVIRPGLTWMWGLVILAGAAIYLVFWRSPGGERTEPPL